MGPKIFMSLASGSQMPALGLGTQNVQNPEVLEAIILKALDKDFRYIDTAFTNGNEHLIGSTLKTAFSERKVSREEVFISSKLPYKLDASPDQIDKYLQKSLKYLQLDYIDLYLLQCPLQDLNKNQQDNVVHLWKKMEEQVKLGRVKSIGLCNFNMKGLKLVLLNAKILPAVLQLDNYNCLQLKDLVNYCHEVGVVPVANITLQGSRRSSRTKKYKSPRELNAIFSSNVNDVLNNGKLKKIAKKYHKSSFQVVLRFIMQKSVVIVPTAGSINHVDEYMDVFNFFLDSNDMKVLEMVNFKENAKDLERNFCCENPCCGWFQSICRFYADPKSSNL